MAELKQKDKFFAKTPMRYPTYRYNPETCRYERIKLKAWDVVAYLAGVLFCGAAFLVGMLFLYDLAVDSPTEARLRKKNRAMAEHYTILKSELLNIEAVLDELQGKDEQLHRKFFGTEPENSGIPEPWISKSTTLLADADAFSNILQEVNHRSTGLLQRSKATNIYFARHLSLKPEDCEFINYLPSLQPVRDWRPEKIISGFGMRINPFHKGLYRHPGVDIAMPRGTEVIATADGVVKLVSHSTLQAGYGNYVEIDHGHGFVTRYAHLDEILVKHGKKVKKGSTIGTIGSSGGSVAPHLHYEIIRNGENVDPVHYMIEGLTSAEYHQLKIISEKKNQSLD